MNDYELDFDDEGGFTDEEKKQIAEEARLAFAIAEGTMPMARGLGLSPSILDQGMMNAGSPLIAEIMDKLEEMDTRISVTQVSINQSLTGEALVKVTIERAGEE